ncbi:hypothetical protein LCGC14_2229490, partial [marine sediment metagenome]
MHTIRLFKEPEINVNISAIADNLSKLCENIEFICGNSHFILSDSIVSRPGSYRKFDSDIIKETENDFKAIFVTRKRYNNNYFFHGLGNQVIISFFAWEHLTNLPLNNGLVFFLADILALNIDNSFRHDEAPKPECIYDFGWNKAGVDLGMRSALICPACIERINKRNIKALKKGFLSDLQIILNDLGNASKWETDIIDYWEIHNKRKDRHVQSQRNQVFISYSHNDLEWLKRLKTQFKPFERTAVIQVWDDTRIGTGDDWK